MAHRVQDCGTLFKPQLWIYISWWFLLWRTLLETENSGFNSADFTNPFCVIWFLPQAAGLQRWERPHRPGSHGLWKVQLERAERVHTASLKMLNDTQIKDGLRTDASSLDALIGEFRMFLFSCPGSASLTNSRFRTWFQNANYFAFSAVLLHDTLYKIHWEDFHAGFQSSESFGLNENE